MRILSLFVVAILTCSSMAYARCALENNPEIKKDYLTVNGHVRVLCGDYYGTTCSDEGTRLAVEEAARNECGPLTNSVGGVVYCLKNVAWTGDGWDKDFTATCVIAYGGVARRLYRKGLLLKSSDDGCKDGMCSFLKLEGMSSKINSTLQGLNRRENKSAESTRKEKMIFHSNQIGISKSEGRAGAIK